MQPGRTTPLSQPEIDEAYAAALTKLKDAQYGMEQTAKRIATATYQRLYTWMDR